MKLSDLQNLPSSIRFLTTTHRKFCLYFVASFLSLITGILLYIPILQYIFHHGLYYLRYRSLVFFIPFLFFHAALRLARHARQTGTSHER